MAVRNAPRQTIDRGQPLTLERLQLGPQTALVFENRDGAIIDEWMLGEYRDEYDEIALMCYWLDEKIVRAPDPLRIAQIYKNYEDSPGETVSDLILVSNQITHAEPLAAMISRAVTVSGVQHVSIFADLTVAEAFERLGGLLVDSALQSMHLSTRSYHREGPQQPAPDPGLVIQQLPREAWMPEIIRERNFGAGPKPSHTYRSDRRL